VAQVFLSEILICMKTVDLISVVDALIASNAFTECPVLKEKLYDKWLRAFWDFGPRLSGFKARLCC